MVAHFIRLKDFNRLSLIIIERSLHRAFNEDDYDLFTQFGVDAFDCVSLDALCRYHLHELVIVNHLHHDFSTSNELSVDV